MQSNTVILRSVEWPLADIYSNIMHFKMEEGVKLGPEIEMPFTRKAAIQVLEWGANSDASPYSHKQIAAWCDKFWEQPEHPR